MTEYLLLREVSVSEGSKVHSCLYDKNVYSYFEKGCRKKCSRQSRKVLWVVLSSSKKFERMAQEAVDVCLRVLKESN